MSVSSFAHHSFTKSTLLNTVGTSLLANFEKHWNRLAGNDDFQHELVKPVVDRVYVQDSSVVAMTLHANYHLVLNHKTNGPTEFSADPLVFTHGSDGKGSLTPIPMTIAFVPAYIANLRTVHPQATQQVAEGQLRRVDGHGLCLPGA